MQIIAANHVEKSTVQAKSNPDWVVLGWRKWRFVDWFESVYPAICQGYVFHRCGPYLVGYQADIEEGHA